MRGRLVSPTPRTVRTLYPCVVSSTNCSDIETFELILISKVTYLLLTLSTGKVLAIGTHNCLGLRVGGYES